MNEKELAIMGDEVLVRQGCKMLQVGTAGGTTVFHVLPLVAEVGGTLVTVDIDEVKCSTVFQTPSKRNDLFQDRLNQHPNKMLVTYHRNGSDAFFENNTEEFDIIFIDGDHRRVQAQKDLDNAMSCLSEGGIIFLHDVVNRTQTYGRVHSVAGVFDDFKTEGWTKHHYQTKHGLAHIKRLP